MMLRSCYEHHAESLNMIVLNTMVGEVVQNLLLGSCIKHGAGYIFTEHDAG